MGSYTLDAFMADVDRITDGAGEPADCVLAAAPLMQKLLREDRSFLEPAHFRHDPDHYARNAIRIAGPDRPSLYALVWEPGQWTPVHDHGTWGIVGVVEGVLEERNLMRADHARDDADAGIDLRRGGVILLGEGTVTSFVPNPDHIHRTGVPADRPRAVSLHLYGRELSDFHVYDVDSGTRRLIAVGHTES